MDQKSLRLVSKRMSLILRHKAENLGLEIDPEGFVPLDALLAQLRIGLPDVCLAAIEAVVATVEPDKQRFTIVDDCVRANYGHSLSARIAYPAQRPPDILYHGSSGATSGLIGDAGLLPMRRQFVHLTTDPALAAKIGMRHGAPAVFTVDAARAYADGVVFHNANKGFWLVSALPARYLSVDAGAVRKPRDVRTHGTSGP